MLSSQKKARRKTGRAWVANVARGYGYASRGATPAHSRGLRTNFEIKDELLFEFLAGNAESLGPSRLKPA
jgi:hypothetical protein